MLIKNHFICDEKENESGVGGAGGKTDDDSSQVGEKDGMIPYDNFRKLLGEKKTVQAKLAEKNAKLAELIAEKEANELAEQVKQGKYKEALETEKEKRIQLENKFNELKSDQVKAVKIHSFLGALDGNIRPAYYNHIPTSKIEFDESTGEVDQMSIKTAIDEFKVAYPELILAKNSGDPLPTGKPNSSGNKLTYDEWKALPNAEEMKKRRKDVIEN